MNKTILMTALLLAGLAHPAFASYAPIKYHASREKIAAACTRLGADGQSWGLDAASGDYGCRNLVTGNTVKCRADGSCTDYSGDPRWKNIQTILKGGGQRTLSFKVGFRLLSFPFSPHCMREEGDFLGVRMLVVSHQARAA